MTLQEFITKYTGVGVDYDKVSGFQCVQLINQYLVDVLCLQNPIQALPGPTAWEIWSNYNGSLFTKIDNTPNGVPNPGDIVFFAPTNGLIGAAGHVCIFIKGDVNSFTSFDQNFPEGSLPHEQTHTYEGVAGWLHPQESVLHGFLKNPTLSNEGLNTYGLDVTNKQTEQSLLDLWDEHQKGLWIPVAQYNALKKQVTDLQEQITELNSTHVTDTTEIASLNGSLSSLTASNKDYATQALDAEKAKDAIMENLTKIYNATGLDTSGKTDAQLVEEVISELAKNETLTAQAESQTTPEGINSFYETTLKKIISYAIDKGINPFLQAKGWHMIDASGNIVDDQLFDKLKLFFDDAFSNRDMILAGIKNTGSYMKKAKGLWQSFTELFVKSV